MSARLERTLDVGLNVWLFNANTFSTQAGLAIFGLIYNLYLASLGFREDYIGLFWFANTAALGASAIPAGFVSNRIGPRLCLSLASVLMGACMVGVGLVTAPLSIVVVGALLGAATALLFVPGGPFMMDNCRTSDRMKVFSINAAVVSVAAVIGNFTSGYLPLMLGPFLSSGVDRSGAYRSAVMVAAVLCALGAVPMIATRPGRALDTDSPLAASALRPLSEGAARRALPRIAGSVCLAALGTGLVLPFYNVYLSERLGASVTQVGTLFAVGSLLMVPSSLLGPLLARRWGIAGAVAGPRALTAPFLLLPALFASPLAASVTFIARAGLMSATFPPDNTFAMELMPPRMRAVQAGIRSASWNMSWSLASLVAGQAIVTAGYPAVFAASAAIHVAAAVFYRVAIVPLGVRPSAAAVPASAEQT